MHGLRRYSADQRVILVSVNKYPGVYSLKIEDGRFKVISTRPLDYEVSMDAQDPHHPPTKPVF